MYGSLVIIIIIAVRVALAQQRGTPMPIVIRPAFALAVVRLGLGAFAVALWAEGSAKSLSTICVTLLFLHPITRVLFVPLGVPRICYWATRLAFLGQGKTLATFNELGARLRRGRHLEHEELARLAKALVQELREENYRGTGLACRAIIDALQGNTDQARELFSLAAELRARHAPRFVRTYCQAWLLAEAAHRGAFHDILRMTQRGPLTFLRYFMRGVAQRLLGIENAPSDIILAVCWLLSPSRTEHWELYLKAKYAVAPRYHSAASQSLSEVRQATLSALYQAPGAVTRQDLMQLADNWHRLFEKGALREYLNQRCVELEVQVDTHHISAEFERQIVVVLAQLWLQTPALGPPSEDEPDLIAAAKDLLQSDLLGELELIAASLACGDAPRTDDFEAHWRTWARMRWLADTFTWIAPERARFLADTMAPTLLNHGAWLYNREQARVLANDVFRWLLPHYAREHVDYRTVKRNVRISAGA